MPKRRRRRNQCFPLMKSEASRSVAANNFVSSVFMVVGAGLAGVLGYFGIPLEEQLLFSLVLCLLSAQLARKLHAIEDLPKARAAA